jgi:hypothetical protein
LRHSEELSERQFGRYKGEPRKKCFLATLNLAISVRIADSQRPIAEHDIATNQNGSRAPAGICPGLAGRHCIVSAHRRDDTRGEEDLLLHGM